MFVDSRFEFRERRFLKIYGRGFTMRCLVAFRRLPRRNATLPNYVKGPLRVMNGASHGIFSKKNFVEVITSGSIVRAILFGALFCKFTFLTHVPLWRCFSRRFWHHNKALLLSMKLSCIEFTNKLANCIREENISAWIQIWLWLQLLNNLVTQPPDQFKKVC